MIAGAGLRTHAQVGEIDILKTRIYPLDAEADVGGCTLVIVEPGTYPIFRAYDASYWLLTGRINERGIKRLGDGMFVHTPGDAPAGPLVTFPSQRFGHEGLADLMADDICSEGHPEQRIRIRFFETEEARS